LIAEKILKLLVLRVLKKCIERRGRGVYADAGDFKNIREAF
jgi:hypothetical protein